MLAIIRINAVIDTGNLTDSEEMYPFVFNMLDEVCFSKVVCSTQELNVSYPLRQPISGRLSVANHHINFNK